MNNDPTISLALDIQISWDNGVTFTSQGATFFVPGGIVIAEDGSTETTSFLIISNISPNPTHAQAFVIATGRFSISGTVTIN